MRVIVCTAIVLSTSLAFANPLPLRSGGASASASINALITLDNSLSMIQEMNVDFKYPLIEYLVQDNITRYASEFAMDTRPTPLRVRSCGDRGNYTFIWGSTKYDTNLRGTSRECTFLRVVDQPDLVKLEWRWISHDSNSLYYDPNRTYEPWPDYPPADFNAVRENPRPSHDDYSKVRNLGTIDSGLGSPGFSFAVWIDSAGFSGAKLKPDSYLVAGA